MLIYVFYWNQGVLDYFRIDELIFLLNHYSKPSAQPSSFQLFWVHHFTYGAHAHCLFFQGHDRVNLERCRIYTPESTCLRRYEAWAQKTFGSACGSYHVLDGRFMPKWSYFLPLNCKKYKKFCQGVRAHWSRLLYRSKFFFTSATLQNTLLFKKKNKIKNPSVGNRTILFTYLTSKIWRFMKKCEIFLLMRELNYGKRTSTFIPIVFWCNNSSRAM